jgi:hypothetical protein
MMEMDSGAMEGAYIHGGCTGHNREAHPRAIGCPAVQAAFPTIEKAREFMTKKGFSKCKEVIKCTALDTTPERGSMGFYAVANGVNPGIREAW